MHIGLKLQLYKNYASGWSALQILRKPLRECTWSIILFVQVLLPLLQWEATAFGRPVLALVLVASLALFPVLLIPSGPSMWLAGMIFGYGLGFVIIMIGTTIGMILPFLIGLLFRDRIHVRHLGFQLQDLHMAWMVIVICCWPLPLFCLKMYRDG